MIHSYTKKCLHSTIEAIYKYSIDIYTIITVNLTEVRKKLDPGIEPGTLLYYLVALTSKLLRLILVDAFFYK